MNTCKRVKIVRSSLWLEFQMPSFCGNANACCFCYIFNNLQLAFSDVVLFPLSISIIFLCFDNMLSPWYVVNGWKSPHNCSNKFPRFCPLRGNDSWPLRWSSPLSTTSKLSYLKSNLNGKLNCISTFRQFWQKQPMNLLPFQKQYTSVDIQLFRLRPSKTINLKSKISLLFVFKYKIMKRHKIHASISIRVYDTTSRFWFSPMFRVRHFPWYERYNIFVNNGFFIHISF